MRRIAIAQNKGGVGKTTTAINLGAALALRGRSVLIVDIDPQCHATLHLIENPEELDGTMYDVLLETDRRRKSINEVTIDLDIDDLHLAPSEDALLRADSILSNPTENNPLLRLRNAICSGDEYDYILIDTPPNLGMLTANALVAANEILIPTEAEFLSYAGLAKLHEQILNAQNGANPDLKILGVLLTKYLGRQKLSARVVSGLHEHFPHELLKTKIRRNVKLAEASEMGRPIQFCYPNSHGAEDYAQLAGEIDG